MDNKIVRFDQRTNPRGTKRWLAEVIEVENGEATNIFLPELVREVNVYAHLTGITPLKVGDTVLVQNVYSNYIVTHKLSRKDESLNKGLFYIR